MSTNRIRVLGVDVEALTMAEMNRLIADAVEGDQRMVLANHNLHSVHLYHRDPKMREFYRIADHIHVDGMPIVALARALGTPISREHRVTYVDWIGPLAAMAAKNNWRVFYLGSRPGVAEKGAEVLRQRYPGLQMQTAHGFFDATPGSAEDEHVVSRINAYQPDMLILGMGMPRQEHWLVDHVDRLTAKVVLNGGAAIDYVAGEVPTPPRWAGRMGLEWFFRLTAEPGRLWKRYLLEPWYVMPRFVAEFVGARSRGPSR